MKSIAVLLLIFIFHPFAKVWPSTKDSAQSKDIDCPDINYAIEGKIKKLDRMPQSSDFIEAVQEWEKFLSSVPLVSQGRVGWCYAQTAVQMFDHFRLSYFPEKFEKRKISLSSPLYAALIFKEYKDVTDTNRKKTGISGGSPHDTLKAMKSFGMCKKRIVRSIIDDYDINPNINETKFAELIEIIAQQLEKDPLFLERSDAIEITLNIFFQPPGYTQKNLGKMKDFNLKPFFEKIRAFFPKNNSDKLFYKFLAKEFLYHPKCSNKKNMIREASFLPNPDKVSLRIIGGATQKYLKQKIRRYFTSHKNSIGITYCVNAIRREPKGGSINDMIRPPKEGQFHRTSGPDCYPHASIIIGLQKIQGQCHYLLRNSHGRDCDRYKYPCKYDLKNNPTSIAIPEDVLLDNMFFATFIDGPDYSKMKKAKKRSSGEKNIEHKKD